MGNQLTLKQITHSIWVKEQPLKYLGLEVGTRMTIIRLLNEQLIIISPIELDSQTIKEINSLGIVKYIIVPNLFHYLFVRDCQNIYQEASLIAAPGLELKKPEIQSDYIFTQDAISFNGELEYFLFAGFQVSLMTKIVPINEVVFYHSASQTLIITDIAFHLDRSFPLITQFASRIIGCYQRLQPSLLEKIAIKDREQLTVSIKQLLEWDFKRVIMAHGTIVEENAKERFRAGYEWLLDANLGD